MDKNTRKKLIIVGLIVLVILLLILLVLLFKSKLSEIDNANKVVNVEMTEEQYNKMLQAIDEAELKELSGMTEQKRMHHYAAKFFKAIESKSYAKAYSYLNSDFKNNYFKTEEAFETYASKYFPKEMSTKYTNMERLGNIYVLVTEVRDILSSDPNNFDFYVVIKENAYGNFELSFSVDKPMKKYQSSTDEEF